MVVPVRSEGMASYDKTGRFTPPRGDQGLQVPDEMRNRFIQALPEVDPCVTSGDALRAPF